MKLTRRQKQALQKGNLLDEKIHKTFSFKLWLNQYATYLLIFAFLICIAYINGINNSFVSDDFGAIVNNPYNNGFKNVTVNPMVSGRPFLLIIIHWLFNLSPWPYRLLNIMFHFGTVSSLFFLLTLISTPLAAFIAASLFAVHPILVESITWISGGHYAMYSFFIMTSLSLYILSDTQRKYVYYSIFAYILALISSEKSLVFIFIVTLYEVLFLDIKKNWKKLLPFVALTLVWGVLTTFHVTDRQVNLIGSSYQTRGLQNPLEQIPLAISTYIELLFWPQRLTLYHSELFTTNPEFALRVLTTIVFFGLIVYALKKNSFIFFWLSFFVIALLPSLTPLKIAWVAAERYAYLGTIGITTIVGYVLSKLIIEKKKQTTGYIIVIFILIVFTIRTVIRNFDWKNQDTLWVATAIYSPSSYFNHNNLGDMYMRQGDYTQSEKEFLLAIKLNPYYAEAYHNLGNLYKQAGYDDKAITVFKKAYELNRGIWQSPQNMAAIYFEKEQYDQAEKYMKLAIQLNPSAALYSNLGIIYKDSKKKDEARAMFEKALELDPTYERARVLLNNL